MTKQALSFLLLSISGAGALWWASPASGSQPVELIAQVRKPGTAPAHVARPSEVVVPRAAFRTVQDKWALIIGISKFANSEYNLKYAAKDASDFRDFLVNEANFAPDHVKMLLDEQATRLNIMSAFGDKFLPRVARPGDLIVIYVSTHGTPAPKDKGGESYIVAHDTDRDNLFATGVQISDLQDRIKRACKTDRCLIVMDSCYSGFAAKGARGGEAAANFSARELAQGTGHMVVCSSGPDERSWESRTYKNGVFTHNLIESLRTIGRQSGIKAAFAHMKEQVEWEVQRDEGQSQSPQIGGNWEGEDLKINVPPSNPRQMAAPPGETATAYAPPSSPPSRPAPSQSQTPPKDMSVPPMVSFVPPAQSSFSPLPSVSTTTGSFEAQVQEKLLRYWRSPAYGNRTVVSFEVDARGSSPGDPTIWNSSGDGAVDECAKNAIKAARPFPAPRSAATYQARFENSSGTVRVYLPPPVDFGPYMESLQRRIKRAWNPPRSNSSARVMVVFAIRSDGTMFNPRVTQSSGEQSKDAAALKTLSLVKFDALPAGSPDHVDIQFTFDYNVYQGQQKL